MPHILILNCLHIKSLFSISSSKKGAETNKKRDGKRNQRDYKKCEYKNKGEK